MRKVLSNEGGRELEGPFAVVARIELNRIKFDQGERFAPPNANSLGLRLNALQRFMCLVELTVKAVNERTYERFENPKPHVVMHQQGPVDVRR